MGGREHLQSTSFVPFGDIHGTHTTIVLRRCHDEFKNIFIPDDSEEQ